MTSRESIYAALYTQLQTVNSLAGAGSTFPKILTFGRRFVPFSRADSQPALFMVEFGEQFEPAQGRGQPMKVFLYAHIFLYTRQPDPNLNSAADLNNLMDALQTLLSPTPDTRQEQTLGGLVHWVRLLGRQSIYDAHDDMVQVTSFLEVQILATT